MALGGVPFYWDEVQKGLSATQNINHICFSRNGLLVTEFSNIFKSLFSKAEKHELIVTELAKKSKGFTRNEIILATKISDGGGLTTLLNELEESGFIRKYIPFNKKSRESLYQLSDFYTLFYLNFIKEYQTTDSDFWIKTIDSPKYRSWSGYAYENICLLHTKQLLKKLGLSGTLTRISSWYFKGTDELPGAQVDLLIDRKDGMINLCEVKFTNKEFVLTKEYASKLRQKSTIFEAATQTKKTVIKTLISTYPAMQNVHYLESIQSEVGMDDLFDG
jgi:hypothetical protein